MCKRNSLGASLTWSNISLKGMKQGKWKYGLHCCFTPKALISERHQWCSLRSSATLSFPWREGSKQVYEDVNHRNVCQFRPIWAHLKAELGSWWSLGQWAVRHWRDPVLQESMTLWPWPAPPPCLPPALCPVSPSTGPCHPTEMETSRRCLCRSSCWRDLREVRRPRPCSSPCSWPCMWWPSWGTSPWSWSSPWIPVCTPQCTSSSRTSPS